MKRYRGQKFCLREACRYLLWEGEETNRFVQCMCLAPNQNVRTECLAKGGGGSVPPATVLTKTLISAKQNINKQRQQQTIQINANELKIYWTLYK